MARGVSTVLDVAVCLLLVGVAMATLAATPPTATADAPDADGPAQVVATSTTGIAVGGDTRDSTLADHLATAAVSAATVEDRRLVETSYPEAVENATAATVGRRTHVTATWKPYEQAPVRGRVTAGNAPPDGADVAATTLTVYSGATPPGGDDTGSLETLGRALADAVVTWLFPQARTRAALLDPRTAPATAQRYHDAANAIGVHDDSAVAGTDVDAANDALAAELGARFEADLEARYRSREAAGPTVTVHEVEIIVRRWSP